MSAKRLARIGAVVVLTASAGHLMEPREARADDYSDLLDILRAKGSLTSSEYKGLLAKHLSHARAEATTTRGSRMAATTRHVPSARPAAPGTPDNPIHTVLPGEVGIGGADETADMVTQARAAAASAAQSAEAARTAMLSMQPGGPAYGEGFVRMEKYVPGKGLTFDAGPVKINLSGFVNGFYTFNSPGRGGIVNGGVSTGANGFDSSALRNGLLPAGLILKLSTTQAGIDMSAVMGMYPGIDNNKPGAMNANSGGSPVGLGTAGIDFRQVFVTAGTKSFGTIKIGRDLGIFGGDAILNDATLLSVGSTGSNTAPGNTSLGRIGVGYVYADWIPQISYLSPKVGGFQGNIGILQPLDEYNFAGDNLSAGSTQHSSPMVQGKVTYDFKVGGLSARIWASFLVQHQQDLTRSQTTTVTTALREVTTGGMDGGIYNMVQTSTSTVPVSEGEKRGVMAEAGEIGTKLTYGPFQGVAYYYRGSGLGTTGLFFDGVASNGHKRASEGYYLQGMYNVTKKIKLVGSYGVSNLYEARGENDPSLVARNESEVGALFYSLTDWLNIVGEYAHTESKAHGPARATDNTASGGAILLF